MYAKSSLWEINWFCNVKINVKATNSARWGWLGSSKSVVVTARFSDANVMDDVVKPAAGSREGANDDAA